MHEVSFNIYEGSKKDKSCKPIEIDNKEIYLSVGSYLSLELTMSNTLLIHIHYDEDKCEKLTTSISKLKSFRPYIAINPDFKDRELIDKLKDLSILSDIIDTVNRENKKYEIVEVNIDVLKEYKPFGKSILKDYRNRKMNLEM